MSICKCELISMYFNVNKSFCMRFWPRFNVNVVNLVTDDGRALQLVGVCRYFDVYPIASRHFKRNWDNCKSWFYRSTQYCLLSNYWQYSVLWSYCKCYVYARPAIWFTSMSSKMQHITNHYQVSNAFMKMIATKTNNIFLDCPHAFDCVIYDRIARRKWKF